MDLLKLKYIVTEIINSTDKTKSKSDITEDTIFEQSDRSVGKKKRLDSGSNENIWSRRKGER